MSNRFAKELSRTAGEAHTLEYSGCLGEREEHVDRGGKGGKVDRRESMRGDGDAGKGG